MGSPILTYSNSWVLAPFRSLGCDESTGHVSNGGLMPTNRQCLLILAASVRLLRQAVPGSNSSDSDLTILQCGLEMTDDGSGDIFRLR